MRLCWSWPDLCRSKPLGQPPLQRGSPDRPTYNPLSLALRQQGLLEKAFADDGQPIHWVKTRGSNNALKA